MKFGVREICDVVLKAKTTQKIGNKVFYKNEPVLYFDSLKTSNLEGSATTVYAQGGRGNSRLIAWEGERTVTFTMEDALLSPESFSILAGANLLSYNEDSAETIKEHVIEETDLIEFFPGYQKSTRSQFKTGTQYYTWEENEISHQYEYKPVTGTPDESKIDTYYDTMSCKAVYYSTMRFGNHYPNESGDQAIPRWTKDTAGWRWQVNTDNVPTGDARLAIDINDAFTPDHYFRLYPSIFRGFYVASRTGEYQPVSVVKYSRNAYKLTLDTEIDTHKTYYTYNLSTKQFTVVANPQVASIGTYYEVITAYYWRTTDDPPDADPYDRVYYRREYSNQRNTYGSNRINIFIDQKPYLPGILKQDMFLTNYIYITRYKDGDCVTEPYIPWHIDYIEYMDFPQIIENSANNPVYNPDIYHKYRLVLRNQSPLSSNTPGHEYSVGFLEGFCKNIETDPTKPPNYVLDDDCRVLVDYYTERPAGKKINIALDDFAGTYYLEGSTLFRSTNGKDLPAKFIIPNCKIQSNFTFTMAPSGDPSTFTFTIDALPDYTRFNRKQKVLAAIQILDSDNSEELLKRTDTPINNDFMNIATQALREKTWTDFEPRET